MAEVKKYSEQKTAKGERLDWSLAKGEKKVYLSASEIAGKKLSQEELEARVPGKSKPKNYLIA